MKQKDRAVLQNQLNKKRKHPPGAQALSESVTAMLPVCLEDTKMPI